MSDGKPQRPPSQKRPKNISVWSALITDTKPIEDRIAELEAENAAIRRELGAIGQWRRTQAAAHDRD